MENRSIVRGRNPILPLDYPDPDVIRVGDIYYMVSTTMHFMPGGVILRSFDLINWEIATYVYDVLEPTPGQTLTDGRGIYGKGMWAACIRYHEGTFYVLFVANDTGKTYLFRSASIEGPWVRSEVEGFYHDASLLFDDGRVYIVYGNREIFLTELRTDLSGPKEGGLHRVLLRDTENVRLGYEGSHIYKIGGYYYIFFIHWYKDGRQCDLGSTSAVTEDGRNVGIRTEACFYSASLDGVFVGGDVLADDLGVRHQGIAQGGIVDTPDGTWYGILFQDQGALGRIPVLVPVELTPGELPVFGTGGRVPRKLEACTTKPGYECAPLYGSDDFSTGRIQPYWQWNHVPELSLVRVDGHAAFPLAITTGAVANEPTLARNMLTQRMVLPVSEFTVTVDASDLRDGDYLGIIALQFEYAALAVTKRNGQWLLVLRTKTVMREAPEQAISSEIGSWSGESAYVEEKACVSLASPTVTLRVTGDYRNGRDEVQMMYCVSDCFVPIGELHRQHFCLEHFCGVRFGIFVQATKTVGGTGRFGAVEMQVFDESGMK